MDHNTFITEKAKTTLQLWTSALLSLKQRSSEAEFAALVAFLGIHCNLWPLWMKTCYQLGWLPRSRIFSDRLVDNGIHERPWLCLFNPLDEKSAWVLTGGSGLPDSSSSFADLSHRDIGMTLQTLADNTQPVIYNKAAEVFLRWKVYDADTSAGPTFGTVRVEAMPVFGASEKIVLRLPVVACEQLQIDFPLWFDSVLALNELIRDVVFQCMSYDEPLNVHNAFAHYAAALWSYLQETDVIRCSPFESPSSSGWSSFFRKRDKSIKFHGVLILTGDYYPLWDMIQKLYCLP